MSGHGSRVCLECGIELDRYYGFEDERVFCVGCREAVKEHNRQARAKLDTPADKILDKYLDNYWLKEGEEYTEEQCNEINQLVSDYFEELKKNIVRG